MELNLHSFWTNSSSQHVGFSFSHLHFAKRLFLGEKSCASCMYRCNPCAILKRLVSAETLEGIATWILFYRVQETEDSTVQPSVEDVIYKSCILVLF